MTPPKILEMPFSIETEIKLLYRMRRKIVYGIVNDRINLRIVRRNMLLNPKNDKLALLSLEVEKKINAAIDAVSIIDDQIERLKKDGRKDG